MGKRRVVIDFDNTLHSYVSGWQGEKVANDPPHPGAIEWLRALLAHPEIEPMIYSSRSCQEGGILCMKEWCIKHGLTPEEVDAIGFPTVKPEYTFLTIDDRAIKFEGEYPEPEDILDFQPFNSMWPRWKRVVEDEAGKYGMKVSLPARPDRHSVIVSSDDGLKETVRFPASRSFLHHSIIEPEVRFQVRILAINFQMARDTRAGLKPRPFCRQHECNHLPNEPACPWEKANGYNR